MARLRNTWSWIKSKHFLKRKLFWVAVVIIALILFGIFNGGGKKAGLETEAATPRDVVDVVSQSGTVDAAKDIDLAFLSGGRVEKVLVNEGDRVKKGQTLAVLENTQERALLTQKGNAYQKLLVPATGAGKDVLVDSLQSAKDGLEQTKMLEDLAVKNAREALYSTGLLAYLESDTSENSSHSYTPPTISGTYTGTTTGEYIIDLYPSSAPSGYSFTVHGLEDAVGTVKTTGPVPLGRDGLYIQFPANFAHESDLSWVVPVPNTRGAKYVVLKNAYQMAQKTRTDKILSAQNALNLARAQFEAGTTPARSEDLESAKAGVTSARATLAGTIITAPFSGVITEVNAKVGEAAGAGTPEITMVSEEKYELKIDIPEADIAHITVGDPASVTFDAYGNENFKASVVAVAPSAKVVNGVTTIETTLEFSKSDPRIKDGLSADADIRAEEHDNVLAVPGRSVIETDNGTFVRVLEKGSGKSGEAVTEDDVKLIPVTIGLHGSEGYTEITSGLKAGDKVLTLIPDALRGKLEDRLDVKLASSTAVSSSDESSSANTPVNK